MHSNRLLLQKMYGPATRLKRKRNTFVFDRTLREGIQYWPYILGLVGSGHNTKWYDGDISLDGHYQDSSKS